MAPFRQPAAAPLTDTVTVYGEKMPLSLESMILGIAEKMKLPGFGENAFGPGLHLKREEDMYLRMVANIAFGDKPDGSEKVPAASAEELQIFEKARRHLPPTIFDLKRWQAVVGPDWWPQVVYVMNRGGRFQEYQKAYKDGQLANKYGKMVGIYMEKLVTTKNSMTGKPYPGHAHFMEGPTDVLGRKLDDEAQGFDLTLITYRHHFPDQDPDPRQLLAPGHLPGELHRHLARRMPSGWGLKDGDRVKVVSPTNEEGVWDLGHGQKKPMIGKVRVLEGMRPGVIGLLPGPRPLGLRGRATWSSME